MSEIKTDAVEAVLNFAKSFYGQSAPDIARAKEQLAALRARVEQGEQDGGIVLTCGHRVRDLADGIYVRKKDTGATCQPATSHEIVCARCYNWALELGLVLRTPDEEDAYLGAASSPSPERTR